MEHLPDQVEGKPTMPAAMSTSGFMLMNLPAEIRIQVYEYILDFDQLLEPFKVRSPSRFTPIQGINVSLLRASKKVREAAHSILFGNNTWYFCIGNNDNKKRYFWTRNAHLMRHLMVEFSELPFGCIGWRPGATFPNTTGSCSAWRKGHIDTELGVWHDHKICKSTRENWLRQWRLIGTMKLKTLYVSFNGRRLFLPFRPRSLGAFGILQGGPERTFCQMSADTVT